MDVGEGTLPEIGEEDDQRHHDPKDIAERRDESIVFRTGSESIEPQSFSRVIGSVQRGPLHGKLLSSANRLSHAQS
jgi:hypothetical protein